jgi:hypothetical protein
MAPENEPEYPAVTRWVKDHGIVEIGYDPNTDTFVRAIDEGGMVWSGRLRYKTLDDALNELEAGLGPVLKERRISSPATRRKHPSTQSATKKAPVKRRKGPPEDPMTRQVRKLDAIIEAIRGKEHVWITRLTVVKKLCENTEAARAFAVFLARRAQERLRDKKAKERYRQLANHAVKEMNSYLDESTEDGKWRLLHLLGEIQEEQNEYTPIK